MAIYYLRVRNATIAKSAVFHYAYMSGTQAKDEILERERDYRRKEEEVVANETVIPDHAPERYKDPKVLWNEVQKYECEHAKGTARTYKDFVIALPVEFSREEQIESAREFASVLKKDGMCVSWAIHEPHKETANPHIHVMATLRPLDQNGEWMVKKKKVYVLDKDGQKVPEIDARTGLQKEEIRRKKLADGTVKEYRRKVWKREVIEDTGFDSREKLNEWRKEWQDIANKYLDQEKKVDCRSYADQGILKVPEQHEGYMGHHTSSTVRIRNEEKRALNHSLDRLKTQIVETMREIVNIYKEVKKVVRERNIGASVSRSSGADGDDRSAGETYENHRGTGDTNCQIERTERSIIRTESEITKIIGRLREQKDIYAERARELIKRREATIGTATYNERRSPAGERNVEIGKQTAQVEIARKHKSMGI